MLKLSAVCRGMAALFVLTLCLRAAGRDPELENLLLTNQWFKLREAVLRQPAPLLYKGAVELAFHDWVHGEKDLLAVAQSSSDPGQAFDAAFLLARAYSFAGHRRDALLQLQRLEKLAQPLNGKDPGNLARYRGFLLQNHGLLAITAGYPDQLVVERHASRVSYVSINNQLTVPMTINSKPANYMLDAGSDGSFISESEARRLGLTVHPAAIPLDTYGGHDPKTAIGVALAPSLIIGNYHLRNVDFLVQPDRDLEGYHGLIGLPVLLALDSLRWNSDGTLEIGPPGETIAGRSTVRPNPNLCLAGGQLVAEVGFGADRLSMFLDTGTYETLLFPAFGAKFPGMVLASRPEPFHVTDTNLDPDAVVLDELKLQVGGAVRVASHVHALSRYFQDDGDWAYGNLGMDYLTHARSVTLDFRSMRLTVEGGGERSETPSACVLPPDFGCQGGWACTVRQDPAAKCRVDRVPDSLPLGNALEPPLERKDTRTCPLPPNFNCLPGETCAAVFEPEGKCRIDRAFTLPKAAPVSRADVVPAAPAPTSPAPDGPNVLEIVRRGFRYESLDLAPTRDYVYTEDQETRYLDSDGKVTRTESETREAMTLYGQIYERVVKKNGQPLPPARERAEQAKFEKATYRRSHETAADKARREAVERKRDAQGLACMDEFMKAFTFRLSGAESVMGRPAWIVDAEPVLAYRAKCALIQEFAKFRYRVWIDQAEYRWSRFEGDNIAPVTFGKVLVRAPKAGLHLLIENLRLSDGAWESSRTVYRVNAKVFLLASAHMEIQVTYSNYRKFQTDSRIVPAGD